MNEGLINKFEKEYTDYVNASINFGEVQEDYKPLSFEDELEWIKTWLRENV